MNVHVVAAARSKRTASLAAPRGRDVKKSAPSLGSGQQQRLRHSGAQQQWAAAFFLTMAGEKDNAAIRVAEANAAGQCAYAPHWVAISSRREWQEGTMRDSRERSSRAGREIWTKGGRRFRDDGCKG